MLVVARAFQEQALKVLTRTARGSGRCRDPAGAGFLRLSR